MYQFVDLPRDRLTAGSRFLLDGMRIWGWCAQQNRSPCILLAQAFTRGGTREVLDDFHAALMLLHGESQYDLACSRVGQECVGESEALLLALWADVASGQVDRAEAVLNLMLAERVIAPCIGHMTRVTEHMARIGLAPTGLAANETGAVDAPDPFRRGGRA